MEVTFRIIILIPFVSIVIMTVNTKLTIFIDINIFYKTDLD